MQNLAVCSLSREGFLSCHTLSVTQDLVFAVSSKGPLHLVAFYEKKGVLTDYFLTRIPTKLIYSFCLFWRSLISNRTEEYFQRIQIPFTQLETKQRITLYNSYHDKIIFYDLNVLLVLISLFFSTFQRNVEWFSHAHPLFLIKPYIAYFTDMILRHKWWFVFCKTYKKKFTSLEENNNKV